jgi:hypothetical protein
MDCRRLQERSSSMRPERHAQSVRGPVLISGDFAFEEKPLSEADVLHDEDLSDDEPAHPTAFYLKHADEVNRTPIPNLYARSTQLQFDKVEALWKR